MRGLRPPTWRPPHLCQVAKLLARTLRPPALALVAALQPASVRRAALAQTQTDAAKRRLCGALAVCNRVRRRAPAATASVLGGSADHALLPAASSLNAFCVDVDVARPDTCIKFYRSSGTLRQARRAPFSYVSGFLAS